MSKRSIESIIEESQRREQGMYIKRNIDGFVKCSKCKPVDESSQSGNTSWYFCSGERGYSEQDEYFFLTEPTTVLKKKIH